MQNNLKFERAKSDVLTNIARFARRECLYS